MRVKLTADLAEYSQWPARAHHLESLEDHLSTAASLSRALWELVSADDLNMDDKRSRGAVAALARTVADHASAAEFIFNTTGDNRNV